jgi:hypothetical protein
MAKQRIKYFVAIFIGLVLLRLIWGQPVDRRFLVWFASFVIVTTLLSLVMPRTGEFFAALGRLLRLKRRAL